jgi:hypothetical protein
MLISLSAQFLKTADNRIPNRRLRETTSGISNAFT